MIEYIPQYAQILVTVIGACSLAARAIAPMTKTKLDDRAANWLSRLLVVFATFGLHPKNDTTKP